MEVTFIILHLSQTKHSFLIISSYFDILSFRKKVKYCRNVALYKITTGLHELNYKFTDKILLATQKI